MLFISINLLQLTLLCKQKAFDQTCHPVIGHGSFLALSEMEEGEGEGGKWEEGTKKDGRIYIDFSSPIHSWQNR